MVGLLLASPVATAQDETGLVADHAALDVHAHVASQVLTDFFTGGSVPHV
jgi:hypothetical protein